MNSFVPSKFLFDRGRWVESMKRAGKNSNDAKFCNFCSKRRKKATKRVDLDILQSWLKISKVSRHIRSYFQIKLPLRLSLMIFLLLACLNLIFAHKCLEVTSSFQSLSLLLLSVLIVPAKLQVEQLGTCFYDSFSNQM